MTSGLKNEMLSMCFVNLENDHLFDVGQKGAALVKITKFFKAEEEREIGLNCGDGDWCCLFDAFGFCVDWGEIVVESHDKQSMWIRLEKFSREVLRTTFFTRYLTKEVAEDNFKKVLCDIKG
jgi:hypothetical protein